jgi:peptidoglycan hydrolase-like protein with peptidoglycan-binding domain
MKRIRLLVAATGVLAAASGLALTPALASAAPASAAGAPSAASAAVFCTGTSLVAGTSDRGAVQLRVPTLGNGGGVDNCNLELGDDNVAVSRLQIGLDSSCNFSADIPVDGDYGPLTRQAVISAQLGLGVAPDGEYGPVTGSAMEWPVAGSNGTACGHILKIKS